MTVSPLSPAATVREKLAKRAAKAGIAIESEVLEGLAAYFELLQKWNRKVSLTSLPVDAVGDEAVDRLLIEPVVAAKYLPSGAAAVIDIGSGGGSPAVPMKLVAPRPSLRMVESRTRKAAFLREVVRALSLTNAVVDAVRYEELLSRPELHDSADVVTIRAVRVEMKLLAEVQTLLRPGGLVFLFTASLPRARAHCPPQLSQHASHSLLSALGSKLEIFHKTV